MRFWWLVLVLAIVIVLAACGPRDRPSPPADTVVVDTVVVDSIAPVPADTVAEFGPEAEVPLADTLVPRRARGLLSASAADAGLVVGLSTYLPTALWDDGLIGATILAGIPNTIAPLLRLAHASGFALAFTLPRRLMTANAQQAGPFSRSRAFALIDEIARRVPPDTLKKYTANRTLLYISILDDMGCTHCWGGTAISQQATAEITRYAQLKLGDANIALRVHPEWMIRSGGANWDNSVDLTTVQWHTKKRIDQNVWYKTQRDLLPRLGVAKLVYAVNVEDCDGPNSDPCTPDELRRYGAVAIDQPGSCAMMNWHYDARRMQQPGYREAWQFLVAYAAAKDRRTCAR